MTDYALTKDGELYGDTFLSELWLAGFSVKRYGDQAGLEARNGEGSVPRMELMRRWADRQDEYSAVLRNPATALRRKPKRGKR